MLKLKFQYFGHLMRIAYSLEKTLMLDRLRAGGEGGNRGWDSWMASLIPWTWTWANSRRWRGTGKHGMLQSIGSQRVRHDLATEHHHHRIYLHGSPAGSVDISRLLAESWSTQSHLPWLYFECLDALSKQFPYSALVTLSSSGAGTCVACGACVLGRVEVCSDGGLQCIWSKGLLDLKRSLGSHGVHLNRPGSNCSEMHVF